MIHIAALQAAALTGKCQKTALEGMNKDMVPARVVRTQLKTMHTFTSNESIATERKLQERIGTLMRRFCRVQVDFSPVDFPDFPANFAMPKLPEGQGAVLYLHGGGYCCGGPEYAKGFGSVLATRTNIPVLCPAYRLAPEHPFPAALEDAMTAYRYLLQRYDPAHILLTGESAGGGLIYSLCLLAKAQGLPLPGGLVSSSPWTDLTASGPSYQENRQVDPSMSAEHLAQFARCYTDDPAQPLVSPLFGDLSGLPESLIFVGGDEIMRDDATALHEKLLASGCKSRLTVAPGMWHAYLLYYLRERKEDMDAVCAFVRSVAL